MSTNYTRQTGYVPKRQDCFESIAIWNNFCIPTPLDQPLLKPFRHKVDVKISGRYKPFLTLIKNLQQLPVQFLIDKIIISRQELPKQK